MIEIYPAERPFRLWLRSRRLFYAQEYHFADISKKVYLYGGCMNRKIWLVLRISHRLLSNGECSRHPFLTKQVRCTCLKDDAICRILFLSMMRCRPSLRASTWMWTREWNPTSVQSAAKPSAFGLPGARPSATSARRAWAMAWLYDCSGVVNAQIWQFHLAHLNFFYHIRQKIKKSLVFSFFIINFANK